MTTALIPSQSADLAVLTPLLDAAQTYANNAQSAATKRAYATDWRDFAHFCQFHHVAPLPAAPATVALYLVDLINRCAVSTVQRRLAAINHMHRQARLDSPTRSAEVRTILQGIKRTHGTEQVGKAAAVTDDIKAMLDTLPSSLIGVRDRALLLIGFAGALRRSELVALDAGDIQFKRDGLILHIRKSKTDQEGRGAQLGIPYGSNKATCPVRALKAWLQQSGIDSGPIFRPITRHGQIGPQRLSDKAVALVVKRCAERAGLDPTLYAGHSLRAGLITSADAAGKPLHQIMRQSRHKSERIARKYIRANDVLRDNVAGAVGL